MDYMVYSYLTSMIESMLNTRLEELTQKADAPFIQAFAGDGDYLLSKPKVLSWELPLPRKTAS